tara:strand:- start:11383 stop:11502 length:120 start_codon:yes stop_codon:yes gene_type:complete
MIRKRIIKVLLFLIITPLTLPFMLPYMYVSKAIKIAKGE